MQLLMQRGSKSCNHRTYVKKLEDAKEELERLYSIKVLIMQADVNAGADNEAVVNKVVEETVKEFGGIDVLINNAQASASGVSIADHTTEQFNLAMYSGLYAAFYYMKACYPYLAKSKGSVIKFCIRCRSVWKLWTVRIRSSKRRYPWIISCSSYRVGKGWNQCKCNLPACMDCTVRAV